MTVWSFIRLIVQQRGGAPAQAFEAMVRPHLENLYRLAYRFTGSAEDAEDLVQTLLVKLIPQQGRMEQVDQLGPWLARALYYLFIDQTRHRAGSALDQADGDGEESLASLPADEAQQPHEIVDKLLTRQRISEALLRLPEEQRAIIAWHDIEGYTLEELAEQHNIPIGTLKSRLHRARARLRTMLLQPFRPGDRVGRT
jgi:RNA polymerase sigma-70 factor (ECF subfamily)